MGNLIAVSSEAKVDKRETTKEGGHVSPRGRHIKIGGPTIYPYATEAVMAGQRGHDSVSLARTLGARDYVPVSTAKKQSLGDANVGV